LARSKSTRARESAIRGALHATKGGKGNLNRRQDTLDLLTTVLIFARVVARVTMFFAAAGSERP